MIPVSLLFFCSGFAALIYELLWLRQLGLIFGNTVQAAAAVMTAFMLGLALGAKVSGKWAEGLKNPLKTFGWLEAGIGACALAMPFLFQLLRIIYRATYQTMSDDPAFLTLVRFVLTILTLLVPTALMGATLPVLCKGLLTRKERFGASLGLLYGLNTLGAASGILLCGFVLIPTYGLATTNGIAICVNLFVCLGAFLFAKSHIGAVAEIPENIDIPPSTNNTPGHARCPWLMAGVFLSGSFALALEVIWFRALILIFGSTTYSFATMLSVFLLGIALGSALLSWLSDRAKQPVTIFVSAQLGIGIYTLFSMRLFNTMPEILLRHLDVNTFSWESMLIAKFVISLIFLLPVTILFGVAFTSIARAVRNSVESSSRTVGNVYTVNTIGAAVGSCLGGFLLLPRFGVTSSLLVICMAMFLMIIVFNLFIKGPIWSRIGITVLAMLGVLLVLVKPPQWDSQVLSAGPYFNPKSSFENGQMVFRKKLDAERLLLFEEGTTSLISVIRSLDEQLYFSSNGKVEADTSPKSMALQRMMGHLPMLFHPNAKRALNIGLGAGVTFGALSCYPLEHLEVVDIEPAVQKVARLWAEHNHHVLDDERAIVTINDGRNHLFASPASYDVITSDPFEPVMAGAANLYTVEHFRQARQRLSPGGIMCQYLPLYELSNEDVMVILRSFVHVFPESVLFFTGDDTVVLGFLDRVNLNMDHVREKYILPEVSASLLEYGFNTPETILGMFVADLRTHPELVDAGPLNTDNFPRLEYSAPKSSMRYTVDTNRKVLLDLYSEIPDEALSTLTTKEAGEAKRSQTALKIGLKANLHRSSGNARLNIEGLMEAARHAPENTIIRNDLVASLENSARSHEAADRTDQAVAQYGLVLKYEPTSFNSLSKMVHYLMQMNQPVKAKEYLELGLRTYPDSPIFTFLRAKFRATSGDTDGALADMDAALGQLPRFADFWETKAMILSIAGRADLAIEAQARADGIRRGEI